MVSKSKSNSAVLDRFPGGENINLLFNFDIVNLLLKTNVVRDRIPNFVIFLIRRPLIVSGSVRVGAGDLEQNVLFSAGWNLIFCVPGSIQRWGRPVSLRFHLFASDVNHGNKDFECKKVDSRFSFVAPAMKRFSLDLTRAVKNVLWK